MREKVFIKNRNNKKISVLIEKQENQKGLVFVMHGLGGFKEQPHIQAFADSFLESGFTIVRFDTTNTLGSGESEGNYEDATVTNYFADLEDVIKWAGGQEWYEEPFYLVGHSLGGISILLFAEKFPNKVKCLAPIATVVSGKMSLKAPKYQGNNILEKWKKTGFRMEESKSQPGVIKKLKWSHMEDRLKYNVLNDVDKLKMPVLLIVGTNDESASLDSQQILFDCLPGEKEIHVIKDSDHNFRNNKYLKEVKEIIKKWISNFI